VFQSGLGSHHNKELVQAPSTLNVIALFRRVGYEAATPVKTVGPRAGLLKTRTLAVVQASTIGVCMSPGSRAWDKSDLRNHRTIVRPRSYDGAMVTQITLKTEGPHGFDSCLGHSTEKLAVFTAA
jgi:hypothetical protein